MSSDLCENIPWKGEKVAIQAFNPPPPLKRWLSSGIVSPRNAPLSSLNRHTPHRIPLLFPLPLSPAWLSEPILCLSHLNVNLSNNMYCIYNIYGSYGSQSHSPHGVVPTYLTLKMSPSSLCNSWKEQPPAIVLGKMDGECFLLSLSGTKAVRKAHVGRQNCPVTVLILYS